MSKGRLPTTAETIIYSSAMRIGLMTHSEVAKYIGMQDATLCRKAKGLRPFTGHELGVLVTKLEISQEDTCQLIKSL